MIAHVGGVPVEELFPLAATMVTGAGAYTVVRFSSLYARLRAGRGSGGATSPGGE